jgi:hypothetical protein
MDSYISYGRSLGYGPLPGARPSGPLELDLDLALDELRRSFPGLCMWWGEYSGSLWALLPDRLVEAKTAADLARQLYGILGPPHARRPCTPSTRRSDGTWAVPSRGPVRRATSPRPARSLLGRFVVAVLYAAKASAWPAAVA